MERIKKEKNKCIAIGLLYVHSEFDARFERSCGGYKVIKIGCQYYINLAAEDIAM